MSARTRVSWWCIGPTAVATLSAVGACGSATDRSAPTSSATPTSSAVVTNTPPATCAALHPGRLKSKQASAASSALALATFSGVGDGALVADEDASALHVVDLTSLEELGVTSLAGKPKHVLVLADGRVAVTLRDQAKVVVLEAGSAAGDPFEQRCAADVAVEPWALAEANGNLLATSGFGAALTVLREADLGVDRVVRLPREPRAVIVDASGGTAFISHAVGGVVSAVDLNAPSASVAAISIKAGHLADADGNRTIDGPPREATQGYAIAMFSDRLESGAFRLLVPNTSVDPGFGQTARVSGYGPPGVDPMIASVAVIDPASKVSLTRKIEFPVEEIVHHAVAPADRVHQPCVLPRSAAVIKDRLFVACIDIDAVVEYDASLTHPAIAPLARFKVPAAPSSVTADVASGKLYVWSEIARSLSVVDPASAAVEPRSMTVWERDGEAHAANEAALLRGRVLFHTSRDVRIAKARACAACHPEGRDDGIVWMSPTGRRQTPMLAGRIADTAPYGWFGESATLEEHVGKTIGRLDGSGLKGDGPHAESDLAALLAYIQSLPRPPHWVAADAGAVDRGKRSFDQRCGACHPSGGTDHALHDVGSGVASERSTRFDTPSLVGVAGSAPYFHDGRYATLEAVLTAKDTTMLDVATLADRDRADLIAYLETL